MSCKDNHVLAIDKMTMEVVGAFESVAAAARALGINGHTAWYCITNNGLTTGRVYLRYAWNYDPNESFEGLRNRPVLLTDTETGEKTAYASTGKVCEKLGASYTAVIDSINKGGRIKGRYKARWLR